MSGQATPKGAWGITFLLFLYMLVNFADKVVVGLAGAPIMDDLKLTPEQFGFLGSSFFFLFSATAIVVGMIANKRPTRWILLILALVWSLVQFPMVSEVSFTTLVVCRIILGAGEGPAFAVACHALYKWFPDEKRALPTAILSQGSALGVIVAVPALNWIIVKYSWHWAFGALGIVGLVWVALWLVFGREGPLVDETREVEEGRRYSFWRLVATPTFIGASLATFGAYWALSLALTWFTPFIVKGLGFPQEKAGLLSVLPWVAGAIVVLGAGWLSQRMIARGATTRTARAVLGAAPLLLAGLFILAMPHVGSPGAMIACLVAASACTGAIYPLCPPMIGEFTPSAQRGGMLAVYGAFYSLAGVAAPFVMGRVVQNAASPLEGYLAGFQINGFILIAAGIVGLMLMYPNRDRARLAGHTIAWGKPA